MKAIIGVGYLKYCMAGIDIYSQLKFPNPEAALVHVVEPVLPDGGFQPQGAVNPIADIQNQRQKDGEAKMAEIAETLSQAGIASESHVRFGRRAHEITSLAKESEADMIIAGSSGKGSLEKFFMGSVGRALVMEAQRSILIGKTEVAGDGKINAVLATDHSDYANECINKLIEFAPAGIGKITIVCANTVDTAIRDLLDEHAESGMSSASFTQFLESKNQAVCERLSGICESCDSRVLNGPAKDVINAVMKETDADLLMLGAHGHGFLERLIMGSTALEMAAAEPWNTLILRV